MPLMSAGLYRFYYTQHIKSGNLSPILLLHGAGANHLAWPSDLRRFAGRGVIALDLPAHGQSDGQPQTIAEYAEAVGIFIESLGQGPVIAIGHSMGGAIALMLAITAPHLISGLVLIGCGARLKVNPQIIETLLTDKAIVLSWLMAWGWSAKTPDIMKEMALAALQNVPAEQLHADFVACDAFDVTAHLPHLQTPTLILCGEEDQMTPPKLSQELAENLPNARYMSIPEAGHWIMLEQGARLAQEIQTWLQEQKR